MHLSFLKTGNLLKFSWKIYSQDSRSIYNSILKLNIFLNENYNILKLCLKNTLRISFQETLQADFYSDFVTKIQK